MYIILISKKPESSILKNVGKNIIQILLNTLITMQCLIILFKIIDNIKIYQQILNFDNPMKMHSRVRSLHSATTRQWATKRARR